MLFTKDNMVLAKYASKLNIHEKEHSINKEFIYCAPELIGNDKELLDNIVDAIITNKISKYYPDDTRFYERWCYIISYSIKSAIQNLLRLMTKYPKSISIVESIIIKALKDNIKDISIAINRHSIFKSLNITKKLSKIEYKLILLLYILENYQKIATFIKRNTTIMKDDHQFAVILGIDENAAQNAEITLITLGLMSYKGGRLIISHDLIKF